MTQSSDVENYQRLRTSIRDMLDKIVVLVKQGHLSEDVSKHMKKVLERINSHILEMHSLASLDALKNAVELKKRK